MKKALFQLPLVPFLFMLFSASAWAQSHVDPSQRLVNGKVMREVEPVKSQKAKIKDRYRVDVLAPLYLNELVSNGKPVYKTHLPDKVLPGLNFYQGAKLATDSLMDFGYHMDVYFQDIADPAQSVESLINSGKLDSSDLIIGAVQANQVAPLAEFAQKHAINFVSTYSPYDANIKGNNYFNLLQPVLQTYCEAIRTTLSAKSSLSPVIIYEHSVNSLDETCFRNITQDSLFAYHKVIINSSVPTENFQELLDSIGDNIVVMPVIDLGLSNQLLTQLSKSYPKYRFEVYGLPSWKGMPILQKRGAISNIGVNVGAPFYFDPSTSAGKEFSQHFTHVYGGKPVDMAFRGYETVYWYTYLLNRYGTIFNDHFSDNGTAPFTRFQMILSNDKNGDPLYFENKHIYMYRYQSGSFSVKQ